jgi:hypothetical protein
MKSMNGIPVANIREKLAHVHQELLGRKDSGRSFSPMKHLFGGALLKGLSLVSVYSFCLVLANTSVLAETVNSTPGISPVIGNTAQKAYSLQTSIYPGLQVGRKIENFETRIVINRPSPGDDFWYRLPYTISVVEGRLPEGLSLVQNSESLGRQTGSLACFQGTPTKAGIYPVTLRGTMSDGIVTADLNVQLIVGDPQSVKDIRIFFTGQQRFLLGKELLSYVIFYDSVTGGRVDPSLFEMKLSGLPPGTSYTQVEGFLLITGTPTQAGSFAVSAEAVAKDGTVLGNQTSTFEVMPADFKPVRTLEVGVETTLRQFVRIENALFGRLKVVDELGGSVGDYSIEAQGLPPGLSYTALFGDPANGFVITGAPKEAGTFNLSAHAVFADGSKTPAVTLSLQVLPPLQEGIQYAGTYEGLVQRADWNNDNGGVLRVVITSNGAASGFLLHNFVRYPFTSANVVFDKESGDIEITPRRAGVVFKGTLQEDNSGYSAPENPVFRLTGTLQEKNSIVAGVFGFRATVRDAKNSSPYAGAAPINLVVVKDPFQTQNTIENPSPADGTELDPVSQPTGISFSALRISPTGVVTATVWAADGSAPVTVATRITESFNGARFFTYFPIANSSGKSSLMGSNFVNLEGDAAGTFSWFKNASNTGTSYPGGIALQEYSGVIGSRFVPQPSGLNLFGLEEGIANAELDLIGADLDGELEVPLTMSSKAIQAVPEAAVLQAASKVAAAPKESATGAAVAKVAAAPVASRVNVRYNTRTGMVTGAVNVEGQGSSKARTANFRGMLAPDGESVMGHFTIPSADTTKNLIYAGELRLKPRD